MDDLWKEWELLVSSGWQGDGLDGPGNRLGQSHDLPEHLARQQALKSAEKRAKIGALMLVGGQTLGGASLQHWKALQKTLGPREMAARAAERRAADRLTCGQGHAATEIVTLDEEDTEMKPTEEDPGGDAEDEVVLVGVSHGTRKDAPCTSSSSSRPTKIIKQAHSANDTCCIIISSSSSGDDDV